MDSFPYAVASRATVSARRTLIFTSTREPSPLIIIIRRSTLMRRKSALRTREKSPASIPVSEPAHREEAFQLSCEQPIKLSPKQFKAVLDYDSWDAWGQ